MDIEELAQRLSSLEGSAAAQQQAQTQQGFMDKYGSKFSGDEGIGTAILSELSRRGIDTSAADQAVQDILDQLRAEATSVLDKRQLEERTVSDLMDKVSTIEESVNAATGAAPSAGLPVGTAAPAPEGLPTPMAAGVDPNMPPEDPGLGAAPPAEGGASLDQGAGIPAAPPPEASEALPPADMGGGAEAAPPPLPEEQAPPVPSDARLKTVRQRVTAPRPAPAAKPAWRPGGHVLSAVRGPF
jgi:hypothetical protein